MTFSNRIERVDGVLLGICPLSVKLERRKASICKA